LDQQPIRLEDVSSERKVCRTLAGKDAIVIPAAACRTTGFVDDHFTEYRNPPRRR